MDRFFLATVFWGSQISHSLVMKHPHTQICHSAFWSNDSFSPELLLVSKHETARLCHCSAFYLFIFWHVPWIKITLEVGAHSVVGALHRYGDDKHGQSRIRKCNLTTRNIIINYNRFFSVPAFIRSAQNTFSYLNPITEKFYFYPTKPIRIRCRRFFSFCMKRRFDWWKIIASERACEVWLVACSTGNGPIVHVTDAKSSQLANCVAEASLRTDGKKDPLDIGTDSKLKLV